MQRKKKTGTYGKAIRSCRRQIQNLSICLIVVLKREIRKKNEEESISEEVMMENFPELMKGSTD